MPFIKTRSMLSGIRVKEAMQRHVVQLSGITSIVQCVRHLIRYKANAAMVTSPIGEPKGVVSKTDIMGAYYAGLPMETPINEIMVGPPCFCFEQDPIESAIDQMQTLNIHQIYVQSTNGYPEGQMEYSDIVGLLYRYCRTCSRSARNTTDICEKEITRLLVSDVMTSNVASCNQAQSISEVIDILSAQKLGAVIISGDDEDALGVVSKTDLILSYVRGISIQESAGAIMKQPVVFCGHMIKLSKAIQKMFLFDIQRIFVKQEDENTVKGVLSLSDATRFRSGTCKACGTGRILEI